MTQEQQTAQLAAQLEYQLDILVEKNKAAFADLQRRGISFDPAQILSARIDYLIQSIASALGSQGVLWALQTRTEYEQAIEQQIELANTEGRKAQIAMAGSFSPAMIRQLAAETNTFGPRG
jgi:hypothetical protein